MTEKRQPQRPDDIVPNLNLPSEIQPIDLADEPEGIFDNAGIIGDKFFVPKKDNKEKKITKFLQELLKVFTHGTGHLGYEPEDYYSISNVGDVQTLIKLAKQGATQGDFIVQENLNTIDFRNAAYIDDSGYGMVLVKETLRRADRESVIDRLSAADKKYGHSGQAGPAWLIFDTEHNKLFIINKQYAMRIINRP